MSKKDDALKLAREALSPWAGEDANHTEQYAAYHAIREALAEQETVLPGGGHVPAVPVAVYGYCPECGGAGVMRERRPNGDDKCTNGHKYPSSKALAEQPAQQWNAGVPSLYPEPEPGVSIKATYEQPAQPLPWHHPDCEGECIACLIEREVTAAYGTQGLAYLRRHLAVTQPSEDALRHRIAELKGALAGLQTQRKPLSGYINRAGINANDSPITVVEKLERAIEASNQETQRIWQGLTDEEVLDMARTFGAQPWPPGSCVAFGKMVEAKLREKNL